MCGHVLEIDGFTIFPGHAQVTIPGIIAETVLNTDNDPIQLIRDTICHLAHMAVQHVLVVDRNAHQRFVNTTPNPKATKKSKGEEPEFPPLLFPLPLPLLPLVSDGVGEAIVDDGMVELGNNEEEVADGEALSVVACLIWWFKARTAKLAMPAANSELSKTMTTNSRSQAN